MKCEITGCETTLSPFLPDKPRENGVLVFIPSTNKVYVICKDHAKKFGWIK